MNKNNTQSSYYEEDYFEEPQKKTSFSSTQKIIIGFVLFFAIIIILILALNLFNQKNNPLLVNQEGEQLTQNITISKNGELIEVIEASGEKLKLESTPNGQVKGKITSPAIKNGQINQNTINSGTIKINGEGGKIIILNGGEGFFLNGDGEIVFTVNPSELIDLSEYFNEETGEYEFDEFNYSTELEIIFFDEETGEEIIIIIPLELFLKKKYVGECVSLNTNFVNETTHYGSLQKIILLETTCETESNLFSSITWENESMGNVEIILENGLTTILTDYNKPIFFNPPTGEYALKIIFTPFKEALGKKAFFSINFWINEKQAKIDFEVPIDNLEQCIQITKEELVIPKERESITFKIDASTCHSEKINISLCPNDFSCSGGVEGGINLSEYSFTLTPKFSSSKLITITKEEIPGVYGIPIYARISGAPQIFVDEKLVTINPFNGEEVYPEKFVVSTIGNTKDSVTIRNTALAKDVEVRTSICNLYKNSLGLKGTDLKQYGLQSSFLDSWWINLINDNKKYAGSGKYQAALFSAIKELETKKNQLQHESTQKNSLIKQGYLLTKRTHDSINSTIEDNEKMINNLEKLNNKMEEANKFSEMELASSLTSLTTTSANLFMSFNFFSADIKAANTAVLAMEASSCAAAAGPATLALESSQAALLKTESAYVLMIEATSLVTTMHGLYSGIKNLATDVETIHAASAVNNTKIALDNINLAKQEAELALLNAKLTLVEASINSFYSISVEDYSAKHYLEQVLNNAKNIKELLEEAQIYLGYALDDLTIGLPDVKSNLEEIIDVTAMLTSLTLQFPFLETSLGTIIKEIDVSLGATISAIGAASTECTASEGTSAGCCALASTTGPAALTALNKTNLSGLTTLSTIVDIIGTVNTLYGLLVAYQGLTNNYGEEYQLALEQMSELVPILNQTRIEVEELISFLPESISAANWLGASTKEMSEVASYDFDGIGSSEENFNKKRLSGLVGTIFANGVINGAYQGGVYDTQNNAENSFFWFNETNPINDFNKNKLSFASEADLKEDCENKVNLILPSYEINLINDAQRVELTKHNIVPTWDFSTAKVFDVFEEQSVELIFTNVGANSDGYGLLSIPVTKHHYDEVEEISGEFGPFNVPGKKEVIVYKYHMKFNTTPRKNNNFTDFGGENSCSVGALRGETKSTSSLPRIILSWDWDSVQPAKLEEIKNNNNYSRKIDSAVIGSNSLKEPFIDASQLSILISKKLGSLEHYLETIQSICPINPVEKIIEKTYPFIQNPSQEHYFSNEEENQKCFLPLTTREYDGKPALYYYLSESNFRQNELNISETDLFSIANKEELINLIDFNAFLIRDGYGIDFQSDFVGSYSSKLFSTSYSFTNPSKGIQNYFYNSDRFWFSSKANMLAKTKSWALPDAGKYRVQLLIDFDYSNQANLFISNYPSAKIIVLLDLLEPVSVDYSPFYYTPIDGFTGLSANNNRVGYGAAISGSKNFLINQVEGVYLSSSQNKALFKTDYTKKEDFFSLNTFPSNRAKILEYHLSPNLDSSSKLIFSPTTINPIIFEVLPQTKAINYSIKKENLLLNSNTLSALIISKLGNCSEYKNEETIFVNKGPDVGDGKLFGLILPEKEKVNYLKSVVYAPTNANYFLENKSDSKIISWETSAGTEQNVLLNGINTMPYNNKQTGDTVDSLKEIFLGIEAGSVCVAKLGTSEVYFWPEEEIFEKKFVGEEYFNKLNKFQDECIKK